MSRRYSAILNKDTGIVAATEIVSATAVSLGAAHFLGQNLSGLAGKVKDFVAGHIVSPHLETLFEHHFGHLLYKEDETVSDREKAYPELTREERVDRIANVLTKESLVFLAENGLMLAMQYPLKTMFKANISPAKVTFTGASVQLGAMAVFGTLLSKPTDWMYHSLACILSKITSMDENKAKETARNLTYVALPGLMGFVAELAVAEKEHTTRR